MVQHVGLEDDRENRGKRPDEMKTRQIAGFVDACHSVTNSGSSYHTFIPLREDRDSRTTFSAHKSPIKS